MNNHPEREQADEEERRVVIEQTPEQTQSPLVELDEEKADKEAKALPSPAALEPEPAAVAMAIEELNQGLASLQATYPILKAWLDANSGFELIKAHILKNKQLGLIEKLKLALNRYGYAGFIDAIQNEKIPFSEEQLWELRYQANQSLPYRYDIQKISPSAKYFVSICKMGVHSYVVAGCDDSNENGNNDQRYVFSGVGKVIDGKQLAGLGFFSSLCGFLFSGSPAVFDDEKVLKTKTQKAFGSSTADVQYRAYELSYQQYLEYTKLLKRMPDAGEYNYYTAYAPPDEEGLTNNRYAIASTDAKLIFLQPAVPGRRNPQDEKELSSFTKLSPRNTCRHSALDLLRLLNIKDETISSFWGTKLPNRMKMNGGKIITPLFVVPIPPDLDLKKANPFLYKILKQVHGDILRLSQTNYGIDLARRKVNALGELYKQLHKTRIDKDSHHIKAVLDAWKGQELTAGGSSNEALIQESRGRYFRWSLFHAKKTSSARLIEKLDQIVDKKCALRRGSC